MTPKRKPYKTYTRKFKLEAVRVMDNSDKKSFELAAELGLRRNQWYKWKEQLLNKGDDAFPNKRDFCSLNNSLFLSRHVCYGWG